MNYMEEYKEPQRTDKRRAEVDIEEELSEYKENRTPLSSNQMEISYEKTQHYGSDQYRSYLASGMMLSSENPLNEDVTSLSKAIFEEKNCPGVIPFKKELFESIADTVNTQEKALEKLNPTVENQLQLNIYKLEVERIKYLMKLYLRTRLFKIEKFATSLIRNDSKDLLDKNEINFLKRYHDLKHKYFKERALKDLPSLFKDTGLDAKAENVHKEKLVVEPDFDKFVFVRVLKEFQRYSLAPNTDIDLIPGEIILAKYKDIE